MDTLDEKYIKITSCSAKDKLYHYTTISALKNILDTNKLWVSKSDCLNDHSEFIYTYNLINNHIFPLIKNEELRSLIRKSLKQEMYSEFSHKHTMPSLNGYYVLSLSKNPDALTLWSEFSNSIGYNFEVEYEELLQSIEGKYNWNGDVIYDKHTQINLLTHTFNVIAEDFLSEYGINIKEDAIYDNVKLEEAANTFSTILFVPFAIYSMFFKQEYFATEEEYRFVFSPLLMRNNDKTLYTFLFILHKNPFILGTLCNWFKSYNNDSALIHGRKLYLFWFKVLIFRSDRYTK